MTATAGPVRAYVITLYSRDGKTGKVVFDRSGLNADVFHGRTDEQALNQAISNALAAGLQSFGALNPDRPYHVHTVPAR